MIEIIQAIKDAKVAQVKFSLSPIEERFEKVKKLNPNIKDTIEPTDSIYPTGLILIVLPKILTYPCMIDRLIPALLAGNGILLKLPSSENKWLEDFKLKLKDCEFPEGLIQFIHGKGDEIGSFLCSHPAVNGISAVGKPETIEQIIKIPQIAKKKLQLASAANNSAIVLQDEISQQIANLLVRACFEEDGILPWNIKKIFIKESAQEIIVQQLLKSAEHFKNNRNNSLGIDLVQKIKEEGGKILCGDGKSPTLVLDLPHCSTLQQDPIDAPITLISTVKYTHEAVKWANTGYLGLANMIIGDEEKAKKLADKLECGHVWINNWKSDHDGIITGVKQSFIGIKDFKYFGDFYSNRKKIVTTTSIN